MPRVVVVHAADDGPLVHRGGAHRQHIGQLNAGHASAHRAELAAVFDGGVGLGVPHVDVAGTAGEPERDHRLAAAMRLFSEKRIQGREAQPGEGAGSGLQEPTTRTDADWSAQE